MSEKNTLELTPTTLNVEYKTKDNNITYPKNISNNLERVPETDEYNRGLNTGAKVGIAVGGALALFAVGDLIFNKGRYLKKLFNKADDVVKPEGGSALSPSTENLGLKNFKNGKAYNDNGELLCLVELNGKQHYEPSFTSNDLEAQSLLEYTQYHDTIKQNYCKEHNIPLLVIPYYELNQMKEIFNNFIGEILK